MSAILYGCESWMNGDLKPIEKLYKWCIKQMLGVRKTTNNDICLVELGMPPLRALVKSKQRNFFNKMWLERNEIDNDPLMHAMNLTFSYNDSISRYLTDLSTIYINDIGDAQSNLRTKILNSESNRLLFYKSININLTVHEIYSK